MSTSKGPHAGIGVGASARPADDAAGNTYSRFIPREEVSSFMAWKPGVLDDGHAPAAGAGAGSTTPPSSTAARASFSERAGLQSPPLAKAGAGAGAGGKGMGMGMGMGKSSLLHDLNAPPPSAEAAAPEPEVAPVDVEAVRSQARKAGYEDGYRDGLSALDAYKVAQSAQMAAFMSDQVGVLVNDLHQRLELLEQQLSGRIAGVALELARQVVRSELVQRPEQVVAVAEQALSALMASARDVTVRLNPADHAMVQSGMSQALGERAVRLVADATVSRGGCLVESDIAVVDASVSARWHKATAAMGLERGVSVDDDAVSAPEVAAAAPEAETQEVTP